MFLDWIQIEVCPDVACSAAYTVFLWGDSNSDNNGNLPYVSPEDQAEEFTGSKVGILISMSGVPDGTYQFVRVSAPAGSDCSSNSEHNAQIDAILVE